MTLTSLLLLSLTGAPSFVPGAPAPAPNSHLWVVNEIFSTADGSVQFIELFECCGSQIETSMAGKNVFSNSHSFVFPVNLTGNTANRHLLLGTAAFAALPGAPTPDFIIPANFFSTTSDTISWFIYPAATLVFGPGDLPTDGMNSLHRSGQSGINSPTNYAGLTGAVNVAMTPALPWSWLAALAATVLLAGGLVLRSRTTA